MGPFGSANGGVFSRGQALDHGETDRTLLAAVRDGSLVRLRRGMYVAAKTYQGCDDVGRHLLLARAVLADQRGRQLSAAPESSARPGRGASGESVTRVQFYRFGIPMPEPQYRVYDQHGELVGIADFGWDEYRHLGEFDGKSKYEKFLRPGESPSDCEVREKRREDRMRAGSRGMTRFTWASVMPRNARRTMTELRQSLEQSRRLYIRVAS